MSIEAKIDELIAALNANTAITERVVAGQEAALAKLGDGGTAKATRTRKPKEEAAEVKNAEPAPPESGEAAAKTASDKEPTLTIDDIKATVASFAGMDDDKEARGKRVAWLKELAGYFYPNGEKTGTEALMYDAKLATFFIERKKQGLPVDFGAEYEQPEADSDDDF